MRAAAGLWPYGAGQVRLGAGGRLFLPQRPYLPLGTLAAALCYPRENSGGAKLDALLDRVALHHLAPDLGRPHNWSQRLSLGGQRRLAFARAAGRAGAYFHGRGDLSARRGRPGRHRLLREASWRPAIVSVGHRASLRQFHDHALDIARFSARRPDVAPAAD